MPVTAATGQTYGLRIKPQYTGTLAELQTAASANAATYEGKYVLASDQAATQQLYLVSEGVLYPAFNASGYETSLLADDLRFFDVNGAEVTSNIGIHWLTGTTDANGKVTVYATSDGTTNGTALFSSIKSVTANASVIAAGLQDVLFSGGNTITANKTIVFQMLRGSTTTIGALGGTVNSVRTAGNGINVRVRVEGVLA